ncbi:MAG: efflux RND transporter periplasmic adaptor subunit [Anaerolineae bacterium]|nr:efflux RND transporter periplasmic adaptor subunit [Anaerolineae bacterium]
MRKTWWIALIVILVALGGYFGYNAWLKPARAQETTTEQVTELVVAVVGTLQDSIESSGNLAPVKERALSFAGAGVVAEIYVAEGDKVAAGQPLARLDTTRLELSVAKAQLSLEQVQIQLQATLDGASDVEIAAAEASLSSSQASYAQIKEGAAEEQLVRLAANLELAKRKVQQAQGNYDRYGERMAAPLQDATLAYEEAQIAYETAAEGADSATLISAWSKVEQAQASLGELLAGPAKEDVRLSELKVTQAELSLAQAQRTLEEATLVAPFDGTITELNIAVGEVAPNSAVIMLADLDTLEVEISFDENDVTEINVGQVAVVAVEALDETSLLGTVTLVHPTANVQSGVVLYPVTVQLDLSREGGNAPGVRAGMTVDVEIITEQWNDVLYLPQRAIKLEGDAAYVMLQTGDDAYQRTPVTLGRSLGGNVEILEGLSENSVVGVLTEVTTDSEEDSGGLPFPGMGMMGGGRP